MANSSMSFDTAVRILGGQDPGWSAKVGRLLGAAALASGGVGLVAPAAAIGAAWGWIDQKNELVEQIRSVVDRIRDRHLGVRGRERHELIGAAHTAVVTGAFFAALSEVIGSGYERLRFSEAEMRQLVSGDGALRHGTVVSYLLQAPVPVPWAGCGFEATERTAVRPFYDALAGRCLEFFRGLAAWERVAPELGATFSDHSVRQRIVDAAVRRYRDDYRKLAADVPEFGMWVLLDQFESAATARDVEHRRAQEFRQHSLALLEQLLAGMSRGPDPVPKRSRGIMAQRNRRLLAGPLAPVTDFDQLSGLRMPTVESGYVNPRFRWAVVDGHCQTWDEEWWHQQSRGSQLDLFLATYFASARSTEHPLVILGHPGAGKSLLTKITAARLPAESFTTVRVPLRQVRNPAAKIYEQIQDFLDEDTHLGVRWRDLSDDSTEVTRVVLLDGLDELMQATGTTETGFLHEVQQFQEKEAMLGSPVSVVVTSRTVVADIANIPAGSMVVKLEDFDQTQVGEWVAMWNQVNQEPIAAGRIKALSADTVWAMGELARQPLLLLMLAIFGATEDPPTSSSGQVTPGQVYQWLLNGYVTREVAKASPLPTTPPGSPDDVAALADHELWQLGIAAFAMFNRGRQSVSGADLNDDLGPMLPASPARVGHRKHLARPLDVALRTIARFFFVHAADVDSGLVTGSSYEFLHATFGEYLIAYHTLRQLGGLADARGHVPVGQEWTDDQFFALLSHQQLSVGSAILPFVRELFDALDDARRQVILGELRMLVRDCQDRDGGGRLDAYNPSGRNLLSRIAAYLGNLLILLVELSDEPVPLSALAPDGSDHLAWWRSTVRFLHSGLEATGWAMLLSGMDVEMRTEPALVRRRGPADQLLLHAYEARLACEPDHELQVVLGITAWHGRHFARWEDQRCDVAMRLVSSLVHRDERPDDRDVVRDSLSWPPSPELGALLQEYLVRHAGHLDLADVRAIADVTLSTQDPAAAVRIAPVVAQHPHLLRAFPQLFAIYERGLTDPRQLAEVFAALRVGMAAWDGDDGRLFKEAIRQFIGRKANKLGDSSIESSQLAALPPELLRPAIPPVVAILADQYQRRGPVQSRAATLSSGRHRHPPLDDEASPASSARDT